MALFNVFSGKNSVTAPRCSEKRDIVIALTSHEIHHPIYLRHIMLAVV